MDSSSTLGLVISSGLMSCYKQKHTKLGIKNINQKFMPKPINLLCFHLSWPYLISLICKEPQLTNASKDTTINFIYLLSFHLSWPYFDFTSKIFKKNKSYMFHTQPKYTQLTQTSVVVLCNQSPPIREDICMGYSKP